MHLHVFIGSKTTPIVIESDLTWAIAYWQLRKLANPDIQVRVVRA